MAFNGFMSSRSYVEGYQFSAADSEVFAKVVGCPNKQKCAHAYRWFIHIAALQGVRGLAFAPVAASAAAPAAKKEDKKKKEKAAPKAAPVEESDDDFDVFGDEDSDDEPKPSRSAMVEKLKKEAEERTLKKEANQRTLVSLEVKPWTTEQDLTELWKKITTGPECAQEGIKYGEHCHLVEVAFGIKKIVMSFTMGATNSSDIVIEAIEAMEDDVQSVEMTSMNVL